MDEIKVELPKEHYHMLRFRVPRLLYKRLRIVCAKNDLSINKQIDELIRKFVETLEYNEKVMEK